MYETGKKVRDINYTLAILCHLAITYTLFYKFRAGNFRMGYL